jgi:iron complex outermembrane receptor protein
MQKLANKSWLALSASTLMLAAFPATAQAQTSGTTVEAFEDVVITTGTRRAQRSAADTPAPVDVISGLDFTSNAADDVQDLLRTAVPSYNVNTQPISDAASIVRPANLRGLSPDNTLVLLNGKRRHRGAVIAFLGGGIADGAQGVDVSSIPSLALKQVEVLRDGASSQYGSDAIAGVINFVLKDDTTGGTIEAKYGSTYDGDGDNYRIGANYGFALGDDGFFNVTAEYGETDGTVRSVVRDDVQALIAAGNRAAGNFLAINTYTDEVPQYWGQPDVEDDIKLLVNTGFAISENAEIYATGTYAERTTTGGFFYRNPTNRGGVYAGPTVDGNGNSVTQTAGADTDDTADDVFENAMGGTFGAAGVFNSVRVGDLDGGTSCIDGIPLSGTNGLIQDADIFADIVADDNCFAFTETIPGGFVPRFGGELRDFGITGGLRGEVDLGTGLTYDLSVTHGASRVDFFINNTVNASLGPDTPRNFIPGGQEQIETTVNADFGYLVDVGLTSELSVAFGAEYRKEQFDLFAGDRASFALGPLADQGFSSSSNGFGGFPNSSSNSQDSIGTYVDLEAEVTDQLTLQGAVRYEDFSEFGSTFDYKVAGLYKLNDNVSLRATHSTGFHAPTAGQANITNVTTQNVNGNLIDQGTLPLSTAAGQLAADFIEATAGGRPTLGPEDATNFSAGVAFDFEGVSVTVDAFQIDVDDRIALGANVDFLSALRFAGGQNTDTDVTVAGYNSVSEALDTLSGNGTISRSDFLSLDDLSQFRFFSNSFDTRSRGVDVVARYPFELAGGDSTLSVAANYTDTKVTNVGDINPISEGRVAALEDLLPNIKGNATWTHRQGMFRGLVRANYFGGWTDTGNSDFDSGNIIEPGPEILIDAEIAAEVTEGVEIAIGGNNIFDNYPDENPGAGGLGQLYPEAAPTGFNGGQYYAKLRIDF